MVTGQQTSIYWLFDSGKKNGFKALVYMHRYQWSSARAGTDYVHERQGVTAPRPPISRSS